VLPPTDTVFGSLGAPVAVGQRDVDRFLVCFVVLQHVFVLQADEIKVAGTLPSDATPQLFPALATPPEQFLPAFSSPRPVSKPGSHTAPIVLD
jgi:hypothetical protein